MKKTLTFGAVALNIALTQAVHQPKTNRDTYGFVISDGFSAYGGQYSCGENQSVSIEEVLFANLSDAESYFSCDNRKDFLREFGYLERDAEDIFTGEEVFYACQRAYNFFLSCGLTSEQISNWREELQ